MHFVCGNVRLYNQYICAYRYTATLSLWVNIIDTGMLAVVELCVAKRNIIIRSLVIWHDGPRSLWKIFAVVQLSYIPVVPIRFPFPFPFPVLVVDTVITVGRTALWREADVLGEVVFSVIRGVPRWDQVVRRRWRIRWTINTLCWEASIVGSLVQSSDVSHGETLFCRWWTE